MKKILILLVFFFLFGCSFYPLKPSFTVYDGVIDLIGKPIDTAIQYLGYPNNTIKVDNVEIYEWLYEHSYTYNRRIYKTEPVYSYVQGNSPKSELQKIKVSTRKVVTIIPEEINNRGLIRLIINKKKIIIDAEIDGNPSGLFHFKEKLYNHTLSLDSDSFYFKKVQESDYGKKQLQE